MQEVTHKTVVSLTVVAVAAVILYGVLTMPDQRMASERISDAIHELPQGTNKATRELERRTPGEKLGDTVKDIGENIKRNTDNQ